MDRWKKSRDFGGFAIAWGDGRGKGQSGVKCSPRAMGQHAIGIAKQQWPICFSGANSSPTGSFQAATVDGYHLLGCCIAPDAI